jgi:DNA-binding NtrC family response regulator
VHPTDVLSNGGPTILVVDDDPDTRRILSIALRRTGYAVLTAESGPEALAFYPEGGVDLLIVDVVMPEMTGPQLVDAVLKRDPEAQVIFISGYTREQIAAYGPNTSRYPLIPKPFNIESLLSTVKHNLRRRGRHGG